MVLESKNTGKVARNQIVEIAAYGHFRHIEDAAEVADLHLSIRLQHGFDFL